MNLGQAQRAFVLCVADLIRHAYSLGYEMTFGDAFRDSRVTYGHPNSTHRKRLAVDLNLFKDGKYLDTTEDHRVLGEWWEKQHPLAKWGGRFKDGNHYSFEWDGVA
jgi:hypothetical protein